MISMNNRDANHWLIIVLLITALLKIPSLFEPYWYGDEGIYLTLGTAVRHGLTLYRDIHDNKPPLLYLIAAIANTQFWFKFILLTWHLLSITAIFYLSQKLFPQKPIRGLLTAALFVIMALIWEGNIANGEIFMILPVIVGTSILYQILNIKNPARHASQVAGVAGRQRYISNIKYFVAGTMFAIGFLFKVPAMFDFAAIFVFITLLSAKTVKEVFLNLFKTRTLALSVGFALPIILSIIFYWKQGALAPYLNSALLQNVGYLGSWSTGSHESTSTITKSGLLWRTVAVAILTLGLWIAKNRYRLPPGSVLIMIWFVFALYGALLSERPYPHYLIQPAVPAALLITSLIFEKKKELRLGLSILGLVGIVSYFNIKFWQYPVLAYYQNFSAWMTQRKTTEDYFSFFGKQVNQTYRLAKYIQLTTKPADSIFVWGDEPYIYALSDRLPPGRYTVAYHVVDFNGYGETARAIELKKPEIIVVMDDETRPFPTLFSILEANYIQTEKIDRATIYRLTTRL